MTEIKFTSRADAVFYRLESDILTGVYKKGDVITEIGLSTALNVSRTPVREALRRLEQENLIKETSKGHEVVGISKNDIMDIYDIRIKIEPVAAKLCAKNISESAIKEMRDAVDLHEFYLNRHDDEKVKKDYLINFECEPVEKVLLAPNDKEIPFKYSNGKLTIKGTLDKFAILKVVTK